MKRTPVRLAPTHCPNCGSLIRENVADRAEFTCPFCKAVVSLKSRREVADVARAVTRYLDRRKLDLVDRYYASSRHREGAAGIDRDDASTRPAASETGTNPFPEGDPVPTFDARRMPAPGEAGQEIEARTRRRGGTRGETPSTRGSKSPGPSVARPPFESTRPPETPSKTPGRRPAARAPRPGEAPRGLKTARKAGAPSKTLPAAQRETRRETPARGKTPLERKAGQAFARAREAHNDNRVDTALLHYDRATRLFSRAGNHGRALHALAEAATLALKGKNYDRAREVVEELHHQARDAHEKLYVGEALLLRGQLHISLAAKQPGTPSLELVRQAVEEITAASRVFEKIGDNAGAGVCYHQLGDIFFYVHEEPAPAGYNYLRALEAYQRAVTAPHARRDSQWARPRNLSRILLKLHRLVEDRVLTAPALPRKARKRLHARLQAL